MAGNENRAFCTFLLEGEKTSLTFHTTAEIHANSQENWRNAHPSESSFV